MRIAKSYFLICVKFIEYSCSSYYYIMRSIFFSCFPVMTLKSIFCICHTDKEQIFNRVCVISPFPCKIMSETSTFCTWKIVMLYSCFHYFFL